jgi:hypothetical protein
MGISEEVVMDEINAILQEVAEQSQFENTMIVYEHMLAEEEAHQAQWWSTVGPGFGDDNYDYEEWN